MAYGPLVCKNKWKRPPGASYQTKGHGPRGWWSEAPELQHERKWRTGGGGLSLTIKRKEMGAGRWTEGPLPAKTKGMRVPRSPRESPRRTDRGRGCETTEPPKALTERPASAVFRPPARRVANAQLLVFGSPRPGGLTAHNHKTDGNAPVKRFEASQ